MDNSLLMRYRFCEILARIAKAKYFEFGKAESVSESVEKLMQEVIMENLVVEPWQEFRE